MLTSEFLPWPPLYNSVIYTLEDDLTFYWNKAKKDDGAKWVTDPSASVFAIGELERIVLHKGTPIKLMTTSGYGKISVMDTANKLDYQYIAQSFRY